MGPTVTQKVRTAFLLFVATLTIANGAGRGEQAPERLLLGAEQLDARAAYQANCGHCHGTRGEGGVGAAIDFTAPASVVALDRQRMLRAVLAGHAAETRAQWAALDRPVLEKMVEYIREAFMLPAPLADASVGRHIYARTCSVCHGERGDGASWAKNSLDPPPRDFTEPESLRLTRREMVNAVTYGVDGTAMMPFATQFSREEITAVVDFVRESFMALSAGADAAGIAPATTGPDHGAHDGDMAAPFRHGLVGRAAQGRPLYESNCVQCHGLHGDGHGARAAFMRRRPRDFTAPRARAELNRPHLFDGIAGGVVGSEMPAWSKVLDEQQIADIAEYVFTAFVRAGPGADRQHDRTGADTHDHGHEQEHGSSQPKHAAPAGEKSPKGDDGCAVIDDERQARGRAVYDARCYFCHGYSGDAATVAAAFLTPPPRDFTTAAGLDPARLRSAIADGRPGTAMQGFSGVLDADDIDAVAKFIEWRFLGCDEPRAGYHTVENGWPGHGRRYAAAYPIVLGQVPAAAPGAGANTARREGWRLYREACVVCHDTAALRPAAGRGAAVPTAAADDDAHDHGHDAYGGYEGYEQGGEHDARRDRPPTIADPTPLQALGGRLYQENCALCHAADGTGRNWIGRFLDPHPPDLTAAAFWTGRGDADLAEAILGGLPGTSMPAFRAALGGDEAGAIVAYMRRAFPPQAAASR